jgi:hypothetical protein
MLDNCLRFSYMSCNLAHQGRRRGGYSPAVGASAVPAGGAIHSVLGRLGHQPAGTMTGAPAREVLAGLGQAGAGVMPAKLREVSAPRLGRAYRPDAPAESQEAIGPCRAFGTTTPSGKNRGGTPTGELPQKGRAAPDGAEDTDQRLSAFRFLFSFFVARMERSVIREGRKSLEIVPGFRCAPSGLRCLVRRSGRSEER